MDVTADGRAECVIREKAYEIEVEEGEPITDVGRLARSSGRGRATVHGAGMVEIR
jgi:hypothetical protein